MIIYVINLIIKFIKNNNMEKLFDNFEYINDFQSFENKVHLLKKGTSLYIWKTISSSLSFDKELIILEYIKWTNIWPEIIDYCRETNSLLMSYVEWKNFLVNNTKDSECLWKQIRTFHNIMLDLPIKDVFINDEENYKLEDCLTDIKNEISSPTVLNEEDLLICSKAIDYLIKNKNTSYKWNIIHWDIKPENIVWNKFIDFEKMKYDSHLVDLSRASIRILWNREDYEKSMLDSYWIKNIQEELNILKIEEALHSISYYIYKWYLNWYPYKNISLKTIVNLLNY